MSAAQGASAGPATLRGYLTGFVLSVLLTAIPFWLVMAGPAAKPLTVALLVGFAVAQIIVHMVCFLHMTTRAEEGWSLTALVFTLIVVVITLAGSVWVMYHLNANMMPTHSMGDMP